MMDIIRQLKRRLDSYINRTTLDSVDRSNMADVLVVKGLQGQVKRVELFEPFGFTAGYLKGAEVLRFSVGGYEDHTVAVGVADKRYKPRDINDGELILYSAEDKENTHRIEFRQGQIIKAKSGDSSSVTLSPESFKIEIGEATLEMTESSFKITIGENEFEMTAANIETTMDLIAAMVSLQTHVHPGVFPGLASTSPPTPTGGGS